MQKVEVKFKIVNYMVKDKFTYGFDEYHSNKVVNSIICDDVFDSEQDAMQHAIDVLKEFNKTVLSDLGAKVVINDNEETVYH